MSFHRFSKKQYKRKRRHSSDIGILRLFISQKQTHLPYARCGRTVLCIFKKASLTVEASVILPLFLLGMVTLTGLMDLCRVQTEQSAKLSQRAKTLSMYAYTAQEYFPNNMVDLYQTYDYELPVTLFPMPSIKLALRARVHTWTGRSETGGSGNPGQTGSGNELVYVTENGEVYHTSSSCTYLDLSVYSVQESELSGLRNEYGSRYHSCEKCGSGSYSGDTYYVTEKGEKYHCSASCSGLTRNVKLVPLSDVEGVHICSRCEHS